MFKFEFNPKQDRYLTFNLTDQERFAVDLAISGKEFYEYTPEGSDSPKKCMTLTLFCKNFGFSANTARRRINIRPTFHRLIKTQVTLSDGRKRVCNVLNQDGIEKLYADLTYSSKIKSNYRKEGYESPKFSPYIVIITIEESDFVYISESSRPESLLNSLRKYNSAACTIYKSLPNHLKNSNKSCFSAYASAFEGYHFRDKFYFRSILEDSDLFSKIEAQQAPETFDSTTADLVDEVGYCFPMGFKGRLLRSKLGEYPKTKAEETAYLNVFESFILEFDPFNDSPDPTWEERLIEAGLTKQDLLDLGYEGTALEG